MTSDLPSWIHNHWSYREYTRIISCGSIKPSLCWANGQWNGLTFFCSFNLSFSPCSTFLRVWKRVFEWWVHLASSKICAGVSQSQLKNCILIAQYVIIRPWLVGRRRRCKKISLIGASFLLLTRWKTKVNFISLSIHMPPFLFVLVWFLSLGQFAFVLE